MTKPSDIRVVDVTCSFEPVPFRAPLKFGGRITENTTLINVEVAVERPDGRISDGFGSMPLGNIWAWPSASVTVEQAEAAMQAGKALNLAEDRYSRGLEPFVTVLESQRRYTEARSLRVSARRNRLENRASLHLALGGDFLKPKPLELEK